MAVATQAKNMGFEICMAAFYGKTMGDATAFKSRLFFGRREALSGRFEAQKPLPQPRTPNMLAA